MQQEAVKVSAGERVRRPQHIQNASAHHSRHKSWIAWLKGAAMSYLENYLDWFATLDRASKTG